MIQPAGGHLRFEVDGIEYAHPTLTGTNQRIGVMCPRKLMEVIPDPAEHIDETVQAIMAKYKYMDEDQAIHEVISINYGMHWSPRYHWDAPEDEKEYIDSLPAPA